MNQENSPAAHQWTNLSLFLIGWAACVLGGNSFALPVTIVILLIHFLKIGSWKKEREIIAITLLLGSAVDSFMGNLGLLEFSTSFSSSNHLLPLWLACFWALAGTTIRHSLQWMNGRKLATFLTGLVLAPLHYLAIAKLTDTGLAKPEWQTLLILAICWGILLTVLQAFSKTWLERYKRQNPSNL